MPSLRLLLPIFIGVLMFQGAAFAQRTSKGPGPIDTVANLSRVMHFVRTGPADPKRVTVNVVVRELIDQEPVMGATVLLRREDPVRMYGKVTGSEGDCSLTISPDTYSVRVQVTGLASFDQSGFLLEPGNAYTLEIALAFAKKQ